MKKSKIERLQKSREGRLFGLSAAARLFKTITGIRGCVCANRFGPSRRRAWNASAVLKTLVRRPKRTFSTLSAQNRHVVAVAACRLLGDERTSIRHRLRSEFDPLRKSARPRNIIVPPDLQRLSDVEFGRLHCHRSVSHIAVACRFQRLLPNRVNA